jgi:hypothetical protein
MPLACLVPVIHAGNALKQHSTTQYNFITYV